MSALSIKIQKHYCSNLMKLGGSIFEKIWIFVQEAIRYSVTKNVVHAAFSYTN